MTEIFIAIVNMSIAASMVAIAVILVRFPLKKAPKVFSYALWAAVFLRLICPFSFESPASLMPTNKEVLSPAILTNSGVSVVDEPVNFFLEATLPQVDAAASVNPIQVALTISAYIWLCGLILMLFYGIISYIGVKRRVYDATLIQDNIFETDKISTAFVLGFIKPKIYLPTVVKGRQFDYILKHEQVHIQRRDYLIKPMAFLILAIHWFNPMVWLSYYYMAKDMEMSCDEAVLRKANDDIRQDYSTSLISLYTKNPGLLSPLAFGEGSYKNMKARIKNVLNFKKTPRWAIIVCSIMVVLFMAGFTTTPPQSLAVNVTDLVIEGDNSNIKVLLATDGQFGYDYDASVYSVSTKDNGAAKTITVARTGASALNSDGLINMVVIRIPANEYEKITVNGTKSGIALPAGINTNFDITNNEGAISIGVAKGFTGQVDLDCINGSGAIVFDSDATDYTLVVNPQASAVGTTFPNFIPNRQYTYTAGNGQAAITLNIEGSSFSINSSDKLALQQTGQQVNKPIVQNIKNQYAIYEPYGLTYRANEDKLYYKDQIVRYFIDKYNNGQGVLNMWGYDLDGTVDLHTTRNNVGLQGELTGIQAYSQEDFNLRTKEKEGIYGRAGTTLDMLR